MLIVEVSDLVGKTALCHELIRRLWWLGYPIIYQHFSILPATWDYFEDYLQFVNRRVCMDRFIMSEVVYGTTCRSHSMISPNKYIELDGYLRINQSVTVVVTAQPEWLSKQIDIVNREEHFDKDTILRANQEFINIVEQVTKYRCDYDFNYYVTDTMPSSNNALINNIIRLFLERTDHATLFKETKCLCSDG